MSKTIEDAAVGMVIAGLRMLQEAILHHTLGDELKEIVTNDGWTLPDSEEIDAQCERLVGDEGDAQ